MLPDQLSLEASIRDEEAEGILLVESREWLSRRPYHRQRVGLILLNSRSFVEEARRLGRAVELLRGDAPMVDLLGSWIAARADSSAPRLRGWRPAEREMRQELTPLVERGDLAWEENPFFLTDAGTFRDSVGKEGFRMDSFYRRVRQKSGILMDDGDRPIGGRYSFDAENRRPWRGEPPAPTPPRFPMTALREQVREEVETRFRDHPGTLDVEALPATTEDADSLWSWAKSECLEHFGPYEDAMSRRSRGLFHSRISPALNLNRISARRIIDEVVAMEDLPLESREGFIRQVIGWREFVRHVHEETDGHRRLRDRSQPVRDRPGDGGFARWTGRAWSAPTPPPGVDGGSDANALEARNPVPQAFWGKESGLACLDAVVADVWAEGWSHHITRLMILGNIASLLDVSPRDLADWFWIAYDDAWEWVVEPNVMGMATWGLGGVMTTKPYIAGAAYVHRMSDYCGGCRFDPRSTCPLTRLYWAFLDRHEPRLRDNHRLGVVLQAMRKRPDAEKVRDRATFARVTELLLEGRPLPADVAGKP
ncbi:MAG: deoxyribodipyrimidine photolyase [Phycisphaerae bacterium]|nr:deoxyribodipyrimidine photolyase [Phycisphaerae bacterium]